MKPIAVNRFMDEVRDAYRKSPAYKAIQDGSAETIGKILKSHTKLPLNLPIDPLEKELAERMEP